MNRLGPSRADGLTRGQLTSVVIGIVLLHLLLGWGLLQIGAVRDIVAEVAPMFVSVVAPETPPKDEPPPPPPPPRPIPKTPPPPTPMIAAPATPTAEPPAFVAEPPPEVQPPPQPVEVQPQPVQPKVIPPSAVQYLQPPVLEYPRASQRLNEAGRVTVQVQIDEAGLPKNVAVSQSSGFPRLDEAALRAVRKTRFRPYSENGHTLAVWAFIPLIFEMEK